MADLNYPDNLYRDAEYRDVLNRSARLYCETSDIAAAQDAKLDGRPRDDLQSIMADLRADLTRAYQNAKCRIDAMCRHGNIVRDADLPPNLAAACRHPMAAEADRIAEDRL